VVCLRVPDERMDEKAVDRLQGDLGQVLVRPVDGVPRLEPDDALPATLREGPACVRGVERERGNRRGRTLEYGDPARGVGRRRGVEAGDPGMRLVPRPEAEVGL